MKSLIRAAALPSLCFALSLPLAMAQAPLTIQSQGSFAVGGTVVRSPGTFDPAKLDSGGQTLHGDHARVLYQVPVGARPLPLVMWHDFGQTAKTWETTPDGREGFQTLFLRRRFPVYLVDQPRHGGAARGTVGTTITATNPGPDNWRVRLAMERLWVAAVDRHGSDATLVHLPEVGLRGNTHFPFSDLNNEQVASLMATHIPGRQTPGLRPAPVAGEERTPR